MNIELKEIKFINDIGKKINKPDIFVRLEHHGEKIGQSKQYKSTNINFNKNESFKTDVKSKSIVTLSIRNKVKENFEILEDFKLDISKLQETTSKLEPYKFTSESKL